MTELSPRGPADALGALLGADARRRPLFAASRLAVLALASAGLAALVVFFYVRSGGEAVRYVTEPVLRGDLTVVVTATGSLQPTTKVAVSSELSGTVRKVFVDYNSRVTAGQKLAELDMDKLNATVASSRARRDATRARVAEAEVTLRETAREHERKKSLVQRQVSSEHDLDVARALHDRAVAALASAQAEVAVAEAELRLNETNLAKAAILSPIDGIVLTRNVDPGQTVASSLQAPVLFSIAEDLRQMEVQVDVDEADVGRVAEGQHAAFTVDAYPERRFPATIRELRFASETVQGVVTYKAVLTVDNSALLLRPGMTATAEVTVEQVEKTLLVPNAALRYAPPAAAAPASEGGMLRQVLPGPPRFRPPSAREASSRERRVFVLRDGVPTAVPVRIGATDGRRTAILGGDIGEGHEVVVDSVTATR